MSMTNIDSSSLPIPHETMVVLRQQGRLHLGVDDDIAAKLVAAGIKPKGTAAAAFKFWQFIAFLAFAAGLYFAITVAWLWGPVGFFAMVIIVKANKVGNSENLLDAAIDDPAFYNSVLELGGWLYQIEQDALTELSDEDRKGPVQ